MSASPAAIAVIRIGTNRSCAPRSTASRKSVTPSSFIRCWMCDTSMIPFRVARPAKRQHQQHEQAGDHPDEQDRQPPRGTLLTLELTAVLDAVTRRHRHCLADAGLDITHHTPPVSYTH